MLDSPVTESPPFWESLTQRMSDASLLPASSAVGVPRLPLPTRGANIDWEELRLIVVSPPLTEPLPAGVEGGRAPRLLPRLPLLIAPLPLFKK